MRIALITPGMSAGEDDWCIPAQLDLVRELARHHELTVFALRYPHHRRPYSVYGARVVPLGGAQVRGLLRLPFLLRAARVVVAAARRERFDVLHALWVHEPGALAALAGRLTRTPVIASILGGELADLPAIDYGGERRATNRWLVRRALAGGARVTAGSEGLMRLAATQVESSRLTLWPLGVATARFDPQAQPVPLEGEPVLLHVASLLAVKDQETLLRALAEIRRERPDAVLHLVGDGPARSALERLIAELELGGRVILHGALPHDRLPGYYTAADVFVLSSRFESQAMVVLEAAACGCPVVGTAVGVVPELTGTEIAPGDAPALARQVLTVLTNRRAVAERQRQRVLRDFSLASSTARLTDLYRAVRPTG